MARRLWLLSALIPILALAGCLPQYYPGYYARLESPVVIPMEDSTRVRNVISATVGGGGAVYGSEKSNGFATFDLTASSFERIGGAGISVRGMAGRIDVRSVPRFNGLYTYYNISPLAFFTLFFRRGGFLGDIGWRFGLYSETGPYADFRKSAERNNLIDRQGENFGPVGGSFLGFQVKAHENIFLWQASAGWPTVLNLSLGLSRSRHTVSVNVRPLGFFAASVSYTYGLY